MNIGISKISCFNDLMASIESISFEHSLNRMLFLCNIFFIKTVDDSIYLFKYKHSKSSV